MKNLKYLLLIPILMFSCNEDSTEFPTPPSEYVYFQAGSSLSASEASSTSNQAGDSELTNSIIPIEVIRSTTDLSSDVTVNFTVAGEYKSDTDFADAGDDASSTFEVSVDGSVTIPADAISGTFYVTAINDLLSEGSKIVTITITSVSDADFDIGSRSAGASGVLSLSIVDDDCPIDLASFEGTYSLASIGTEDSSFPDFDLCASPNRDCSGDVTLVADPSDPTGTTAILDHASFGAPMTIKFITCTSEIQIISPIGTWFGNGWAMDQAPALGSYNEDTKSIQAIGNLGGNGAFTMDFTKNP